jgi:hypothetical protein
MKLMAGSCFAVVFALLAWGCAGTAGKSAQFNATTGQHPASWLQNHWAEYVKGPDQCRSCHGSTSDPAAAGGISKVSCFSCHANGVNHPAGWADASQHGRLGAQAAPAVTQVVGGAVVSGAGFASCTKCHGANYTDGLTVSCKSCHTKAPHPNAPWRGPTFASPSHVNTNTGNAPECFKCHAGGANSSLKPATPAPAGTAPGCFNATMCHGRVIN